LWINGKLVANDTQLRGTFRYFDLDITSYVSLEATSIQFKPKEIVLERQWQPCSSRSYYYRVAIVSPIQSPHLSRKLYFSLLYKDVIAVEVFKPIDLVFPLGNNSTDLAISFVDWSYYPPDFNMGLWQDVELSSIFHQ
jgi:hypothetical protein